MIRLGTFLRRLGMASSRRYSASRDWKASTGSDIAPWLVSEAREDRKLAVVPAAVLVVELDAFSKSLSGLPWVRQRIRLGCPVYCRGHIKVTPVSEVIIIGNQIRMAARIFRWLLPSGTCVCFLIQVCPCQLWTVRRGKAFWSLVIRLGLDAPGQLCLVITLGLDGPGQL